MGFRKGGSSDPAGSDEEEKYSMENRFPISDDEVVPQDQILKNNIRLDKMEEDDNIIIEKYKNHIEAQM